MKTHARFTPFFKTLLLVGVLLILAKSLAIATAAAAPQCEILFEKPLEARQLIQAIHNLAELQLNLDMAKAQGIQSPVVTALDANLKQKETELLKYLKQHQVMTPEQLQERLSRHIARLQNKSTKDQEEESHRRKQQDQQIKKVLGETRAAFHRIEPGSFKMGKPGKRADVILTRPYEMMSIPTTQMIWKKIAELAHAKLSGTYRIEIDPSEFKGETRPVERVSYKDVQTWIRALNELSQMGEPALSDLLPGHRKGDIYRLPTEAEWEFVVRGQGEYYDVYYFGKDESLLVEHAWFKENSGGQTHPVAQRTPLRIGDMNFYDMLGNVREWVHDWSYDDGMFDGGVDPQGPTGGNFHLLRGGSWDDRADSLALTAGRSMGRPGYSTSDVGFRLVRTSR